MKKVLSFLFIFVVAVTVVFSASKPKFNLEHKNLSIKCENGSVVTVDAEIAITTAAKNFGFMERKVIPDGTGMLFVYNSDSILSFWMYNTPTALSIAYIDRNGKIRDIFDMVPFSQDSIKSTVSVRYALEVPKGWFSKVGVKVGDIVDISSI